MSAGQHKQITHTVADFTQHKLVIMEKPGPYLTSPQRNTVITQKPPTGYVDTGSPELSADAGQEQCVTETQHERNERERKKIIEACGLADSDDDETNETVQPQTSAPNIVDTWRTRFSRYKPDPNYNSTAVCHAPIYNLTDEINLELIKELQPMVGIKIP